MKKIQVKINGEWKEVDTIEADFGPFYAPVRIDRIQDIKLIDESEEECHIEDCCPKPTKSKCKHEFTRVEGMGMMPHCIHCKKLEPAQIPKDLPKQKIEKFSMPVNTVTQTNVIEALMDKVDEIIDYINKE